MPTNLPSSFASAAAGQNANRGGRGGNSSDWSRRDGRSANGTLTLRRSSTTPLSQNPQNPPPTDSALQSPSMESQSAHPSGYELSPARYTKDELLSMARPPPYGSDVSRLFNQGWNPGHVNGGSSRAWGKSNENHIPQEPGACWNDNGDSAPLALQQMSLEERDAFSSDINSPVKPPTMNKEGANTAGGINGRKASLSQGAGNAFGVSSPSSATRPGTRRRETSDANPFGLASPTASGRSGRDDAPWLPRRNTEREPEQHEEDTSGRVPAPLGNLMRSNTSGAPNMASLWGNSQPTTPSGLGSGGFGNFAIGTPIGEKKQASGASRLAHLMPKDGEGSSSRPAEGQKALNQSSWRSRQRTDTDPFGEDMPSGSAALGGSTEADFAPQQGRGGTLGTPVKGAAGDFGMSGLNLGDDGPASPSETNPYRSPPADRPQEDDNGAPRQYSGLPQDVPSGFNPLQRAFTEGHDRSQTSSANRGFPMGNISAWAAPGGPTAGTPDRERPNMGGPFSPGIFNSSDNMQSPGLGNLGGLFGHGASAGGMGTNSIGRGSKLSSMFPAAMQAQMQQSQAENDPLGDPSNDPRFPSQLGAIGRNNMPIRETESPMRSGRNPLFEELFQQSGDRGYVSGQATPGGTGSFTPVSGTMPFGGDNMPPPIDSSSQPRIMVMPDRMRWVYLDPQGHVQGPFTGLEMNDWYKANFFTPDLRVKKQEDPEFEPLGQLIRRIGNSREPFLVPQWGVAYGPPLASTDHTPTNNGGQVVPPLSTVFPSFGRTLTADEQNNLERRKQEEQYILAQQREFALRQQQSAGRYPGQQPGLQHHSSAQSLQSQPSFGSIASPIGGMQGHMPQGQQFGGMPPSGGNSSSFFDAVGEGRANLTQGTDLPIGEDELAHLSQNERSIFAALQEQHEQQQASAAAEEMNFRSGLPAVDQLGPDDEGFKERLQEFNTLRAEHDAREAAQAEQQVGEPQQAEEPTPRQSGPARISKSKKSKKMIPLVHDDEEDNMSLTQQVQQTQAAAAAAQEAVEPDMPMPFPPPSSSTPLPAPTAQRVRSNLPEQYNRSQTGSPDDETAPAEPPPMAPWAKESNNEAAPRGPSLKEIQEAEARKAAQAEEAASALRKAALEQEAFILREKEKVVAAAAAGLPASSTWGHTASPVSGGSPWIKPATVSKAPAPGFGQAASSSKSKTLAEIQAEEERRKQKAKTVTDQANVPAPSSKSYANLAGKTGQPFPSAAGGPSATVAPPPGAGWATVGAGGKVKAPIGAPLVSRSTSATQPKPAPAPLKPMSRPGPASQVSAPNTNTALEDFRKWVTRELARGLSIPDYESFGQSLEALPLDTSLIADAIYANSTIMDGRHFSEEYVRRKKLADKGISEKAPSANEFRVASGGGGGWSEVAKKTTGTPTNAGPLGVGPKEEAMPGFKVVSKKKGKK